MFEEFSAGYYLGRFYVEPYTGQSAAIHQNLLEQATHQVYSTTSPMDHSKIPLVMKLDACHFPVQGTSDVPIDTLALPAEVLNETRIKNPPKLREVLLAKAEQAANLMRWFGESPEND